LCRKYIKAFTIYNGSFPKTFGLTELKKPYFPYYFNKKCNQKYIRQMPSKLHYGYNQMKKEDNSFIIPFKKLLVEENYVFDFQKQLIEYLIL
jgi:hypothetical protein